MDVSQAMPDSLTRRTFLSTSLQAAAGLSTVSLLPRRIFARPSDSMTSTRLSEGLWLFQGDGGNVVAAGGRGGVLLVDSGLPGGSAELERRIAAECGTRHVETLLNTHWHWDHTGGNEVFAKSGAAIVAHENTKLWLGTQVISRWEDRTYPARPTRALPTQTFFYGTQQMTFGKHAIEYGYLPQAHTDGDIYVHFPNANVLVAGGIVTGGAYPIADYCTGGWLGGMMSALKALIAKSDAATRIVSGLGPLRTRADMQAQLDLCFTVLSRIAESYYKGQTWQQLLDSRPTREFDAQWGDPGTFLKTAYEGAWLHINEIRRVIR
jgi:cyclase